MIIEDDDKNDSENHLEHESAFEEKIIMTTDFFRQKNTQHLEAKNASPES